MGKKIYFKSFFTVLLACVMLTSCVKDTLYDTSHPRHGSVTLAVDWTGIGEGMEIPDGYAVSMGDYTGLVSGDFNELPCVFLPGGYTLYAYNMPEGITVSDGIAAVETVEQGRVMPANLIDGMPGWLYADALDVEIAADKDHSLVASMRLVVRQLNLVITPRGNVAERIESIECTLSGVAGTYDIAGDVHGTSSVVKLSFSRMTESWDSGKWVASVRLLGITGEGQMIDGIIRFADGNPGPVSFSSDLSSSLSDFNSTKNIPLSLNAYMTEGPVPGEFSAILSGWDEIANGEIEIH